jgi:hypothetical protein
VGGHAGDVEASGGVFEEGRGVEAGAQRGVDGEEIGGDDPVGLGGQELSPGRAGSARCWVDAGGVRDVPDGGGADAVAE